MMVVRIVLAILLYFLIGGAVAAFVVSYIGRKNPAIYDDQTTQMFAAVSWPLFVLTFIAAIGYTVIEGMIKGFAIIFSKNSRKKH